MAVHYDGAIPAAANRKRLLVVFVGRTTADKAIIAVVDYAGAVLAEVVEDVSLRSEAAHAAPPFGVVRSRLRSRSSLSSTMRPMSRVVSALGPRALSARSSSNKSCQSGSRESVGDSFMPSKLTRHSKKCCQWTVVGQKIVKSQPIYAAKNFPSDSRRTFVRRKSFLL